jgi:gephyrin
MGNTACSPSSAGNPVSSIVCFHLFVRNAICAMAGRPASQLARVQAKVLSDIKLDQERPEYHRVKLCWHQDEQMQDTGGCFVAASTGGQRSSRLLSVRSTVGLLELPQGTLERPVVHAGEFVSCILIDDLRNSLSNAATSSA